MKIFCDIDGVLSRGNPHTFARLLNSMLKVGMAEDDIADIDSFSAFDQHPVVQPYIARIGEAAYRQRKSVLGLFPTYLSTCQVIPQAAEAMAFLAWIGDVSYVTCRKTEKPDFNSLVASATYTWLANANFPNPKHVVFCRTIRQKLEYIADQLAQNAEEGIFIEDQYENVLSEIAHLSAERRSVLCSSLVVWAYGAGPGEVLGASNRLAGIQAVLSWSSVVAARLSPVSVQCVVVGSIRSAQQEGLTVVGASNNDDDEATPEQKKE